MGGTSSLLAREHLVLHGAYLLTMDCALVGADHFLYPSLGLFVRVGDRRTWTPVAVR